MGNDNDVIEPQKLKKESMHIYIYNIKNSESKLFLIFIYNRSWRIWKSMVSSSQKKQCTFCIKRNVQSKSNRSPFRNKYNE